MPNYGRYFEVRIPPVPEHRRARYITGDDVIPIGAPVVSTGVVNADGRTIVELADFATSDPVAGSHGIALFEHAYNAYAGFDPDLTVPSDFSDIPARSAIQLISGTECKFVMRNIAADTTFLNTRTYDDARTFVAPTDLSTLSVGDFLVPGAGNGTDGYWAERTGASVAEIPWLQVMSVDADRNEIEVQMLFG